MNDKAKPTESKPRNFMMKPDEQPPFAGFMGMRILEVTPEKNVVWTFTDHQTMKTISSLQVLDVPGDPTKGEIWH